MAGRPFMATEFDKRLGDLIARRRLMHGMSQKDLAKKVGVSFQQIQKYETAGNRLSAERLYRIANAFEITIGQLVDGVQQTYVQDALTSELIKLMYRKMSTSQRRAVLLIARHIAGTV